MARNGAAPDCLRGPAPGRGWQAAQAARDAAEGALREATAVAGQLQRDLQNQARASECWLLLLLHLLRRAWRYAPVLGVLACAIFLGGGSVVADNGQPMGYHPGFMLTPGRGCGFGAMPLRFARTGSGWTADG